MKYNVDEVLHYGEYLTDEEFNYGGMFVRVRTVLLDGELYYVSMVNGEIKNFKKLKDNT